MRSIVLLLSGALMILLLWDAPVRADGWICRQSDGTDLLTNRAQPGCKHLPDLASTPARNAADEPSSLPMESRASQQTARKAECERRGAEALKELKSAFVDWQAGKLTNEQFDKMQHFSMKDCMGGR